MIEYAKRILPRVYRWKDLFRKELIKCIEWAEPETYDELFDWCYQQYSGVHPDVLEEVFHHKTEKSLHQKHVTKSNWRESVVD